MAPLTCSCNPLTVSDWWFWPPRSYTELNTKRSKRCCSCKKLVRPGEVCAEAKRFRSPADDIEERIYGEVVPLASYYLCERCADIYFSLDELGFCVEPDENMLELLEQYRRYYGRG